MKPGIAISCIGHAVALGFGLMAISATPMEAPPVQTLPVSFISEKDFTKLTQGVKNAPQLKIPDLKPLADEVDPPKPVDQLAPKVADKPAITTDSSKPKADPKPDTKPDPKQAAKPDKPPPPDYKPDQIADLLKKDAAKNPPKPDDNSSPQKQDSTKFDANQVAELLDKRDPQRQVAAAETLNTTPNLGASNGAPGAQLSQSEIDALCARI
jgi:outer membrane biosynthesis protein TonB